MSIKARIRRAWIGRDLYDLAASVVATAESDTTGRDSAHAFIRKVHAEYPNPARTCAVPHCCTPPARHTCDVPTCGTRCHDCDERMTCMGPDARACGVTCWTCPCDCTACLRQREDMRDELLSQLEREAR